MNRKTLAFYAVLLFLVVYFLPQAVASASQKDPGSSNNHFVYELNHDPFLTSLSNLRTTANTLNPYKATLVGEFLRDSEWYRQELDRLELTGSNTAYFEAALRHLDQHSNLIRRQKIQCIGFAILLRGMEIKFPAIGGEEIYFAKDLVPNTIKNGPDLVVNLGDYKALVITSIDEVRVGDFIVRYDTKVGHISAVVAKKVVDGKVYLLVASANQFRDGKIHIFEVDQSNFESILGSKPFKKVLLRNN